MASACLICRQMRTHIHNWAHTSHGFFDFFQIIPGPFPRSAFSFLSLYFFSFPSMVEVSWVELILARLHSIVHDHYCFHRLLGLVDKRHAPFKFLGFQHVSHELIWHRSCSMSYPSVWDFLSPSATDGSCSHGSHQFMCVISIIIRAIGLL